MQDIVTVCLYRPYAPEKQARSHLNFVFELALALYFYGITVKEYHVLLRACEVDLLTVELQ